MVLNSTYKTQLKIGTYELISPSEAVVTTVLLLLLDVSSSSLTILKNKIQHNKN